MAVEWIEKGIRANSISPGYIKVELIGPVHQDWKDIWVSLIPFKRMGIPEELGS